MGRTASLRVTCSQVELSVATDDERLVDIGLSISPYTAHALRHLAASCCDPESGQRFRSGRSLLERSLNAVGATPERVEVLPGDPPRFVLAVASADGELRRIDLDLLDVAEVVLGHRLPVLAIDWPDHDWDGALRELAG